MVNVQVHPVDPLDFQGHVIGQDVSDHLEASRRTHPGSRRQRTRRAQRLFKHPYQCRQIALVVTGDIGTEPGSPLALADHQLRQSGGITNSRPVMGDGLLGLSDSRALIPLHVRPEPEIHRLRIWCQDIPAEAKTGVEKRLDILVCGVEIMDESQ